VQTFLPYADFARSAASLDDKRLGKQRVETYQVLLQLCGIRMVDFPEWEPRMGGWRHPVMRMWAGHELSLLAYQDATCGEWEARGFQDTCRDKSHLAVDLVRQSDWSTEPPPWLGRESLHMTHRSNLVWKDPAFYGQRFPDDLPEHPTVEAEYWEYEWPASEWDLVSRMTENWNVALSRFQGLSTSER